MVNCQRICRNVFGSETPHAHLFASCRITLVWIRCWLKVGWPPCSQCRPWLKSRTSCCSLKEKVSGDIVKSSNFLSSLKGYSLIFYFLFFCKNWRIISSQLSLLNTLSHSQNVLSFIVFHPLVSVSSLKGLIRLWTERYPDAKVDPVNLWDDIITSR